MGHMNQTPVTSTPTHPKKHKQSKCVQYTKDALAKEYSREKLAKGGYEASTKKYKGVEINSDALSPTRLKKVLLSAKRTFPGELSSLCVWCVCVCLCLSACLPACLLIS